jgi:hypothetical protein
MGNGASRDSWNGASILRGCAGGSSEGAREDRKVQPSGTPFRPNVTQSLFLCRPVHSLCTERPQDFNIHTQCPRCPGCPRCSGNRSLCLVCRRARMLLREIARAVERPHRGPLGHPGHPVGTVS